MAERSIYTGCCGFREARVRYFERFPVVELQDPFYEMPRPALAEKWRAGAPAGFQFCLKAWQLITHTPASPTYRRLKSKVSPSERDLFGSFRPTEQVWLAWERTRTIARILNCPVVLFQCPKSFTPTAEHVRGFRSFFSRAGRERFAFAWEPRGAWPPELIRELCAEFDLVHCVDPFDAERIHGQMVYWRLHGRGGYSYDYSDAELNWLVELARRHQAEGRRPIYVFFNNIRMSRDAFRFQELAAL